MQEDGDREPTLSDSGSNIDIITVSTAAYLESEYGIQFHEADSNHASYVMFGKEDAKSLICGWVYGAGLVGKVAVVKDVTANLISVKSLCQRGMTVVYDQALVSILYQDKLLFQGSYDKEIELWTFDIVHLMLAESPIGVEINKINNHHDGAHAYNSRTRLKRHPAKSIRKAMELHQNLRHVPFSTMADNIESGAWDNLDGDITPSLLRALGTRRSCIQCAFNRWTERHEMGSGATVYKVGECFAFDYQGPIQPIARSGDSGEFLIFDLGSGMSMRYGERNDKTTVKDAIQRWCAFMLANGHTPKYGRHDSGSVETGRAFVIAMAEIGISCIPTPPGIPQMQIERHVQTHKEDVSTILASSPTLKASDWDIASTHACLIRSTMICAASKLKTNGMQSPYELVTGHAPRVDVFQEFGLGDVGVVKRSKANHAKYGQSKNIIVQIVGMEVNDTKAVIVEFVGQRTRARRGRVQKVHLLATEHTRLDNSDRVAKCTMDDDGVLTFTIEGAEDIQLSSPNQVMEQELRLAEQNERDEMLDYMRSTMILRIYFLIEALAFTPKDLKVK